MLGGLLHSLCVRSDGLCSARRPWSTHLTLHQLLGGFRRFVAVRFVARRRVVATRIGGANTSEHFQSATQL
jgi:hypothetical protein